MKWADYAITAVRYSAGRSHITHVEIRADNDSSLGPPAEWARQDVVAAISRGLSFVTAYRAGASFSRGATVEIVAIGNEYFLRTDRNYLRADNLGQLPELAPQAFEPYIFR